MATETDYAMRMKIKNGALPVYSYSGIDKDASNDAIYELAKKLMSLQPEPDAEEEQVVSKYIETIISG